MKKLTIAFANMWGCARAFPASYLLECFPYLRGHYEFEFAPSGRAPDVAFYSVYGYVSERFEGATRIVYAGEPGDHFGLGAKISPGVFEPGFYHWGITCAAEQTSDHHCHMPQGLLHLNLYNGGINALIRDPNQPLPKKEFFCNFVYSNGNSRYRVEFFHKLSRYKRVESCGVVERNNDALTGAAYSKEGYLLKQAFQARCKFSIAMENTVFPGYNTEKLTDPFVARSVPIYWGDPWVERWFNPKAFINVRSFPSDEAAIEHIIRVDQDDALYAAYLREPVFRDNVIPAELTDAHFLAFWQRILGG